jgi:hypothetical protein
MDPIVKLAEVNGLYVVEDAACRMKAGSWQARFVYKGVRNC